ncbi:DUF2312 domain-containing protein [Candidatus Nucleicultrix amoebiphila]|uniref:UPF0335 protein GQ61_01665 n=1 Tax=Candidatus Nucleicultrix amoebiphila FS5 TaxID=1414854 RepID=A0A1W6N3A1_9PROT|nr:DUF2312 domain-containing protein [Candidatus Nucleicultrix amoebiphila]ARN84256.1 hypothetical protein GQ61_01665 [Candidatus Nucleicultrix amoebiphila FS5]
MTDYAGISGNQLRQFIEKIERLEEEKSELMGDIREIFAEAKGNGFDPKIMRQVLRIRKMDGNERQEQEELLDIYLNALAVPAKNNSSQAA